MFYLHCLFVYLRSDEEECEIDDGMISNILIVTQTPPSMKRHPGGDRSHGGRNHQGRAKISAELAEVINDGLFYYEQEELVTQDVQV